MSEFWHDHLILHCLSGSRAYGLARSGSDTDTKGVCIPPAPYLLGLQSFEQHESSGGDHVIYALAKFTRLALQGNPNILEVLFVEPSDVLVETDAGRELRAIRSAFLSKNVGERFGGYALSQWKRMQRHYRWIANPPQGPPDPTAFDAIEQGGRFRFPDTDQRAAYDAAHKHWEHFRKWRRDRNPERAALEEQHGYDTKHGMHLVRLLTMGHEVLETGELHVRRADAEYLLGIRDGQVPFEEMMVLVDEMTRKLHSLMETTRLPEEPDRARAEALLIRLHRNSLLG